MRILLLCPPAFHPSSFWVLVCSAQLRLVPDGRVFTHLSRFLLHPTNRLWLHITRLYDTYLAHHTHLLGIQVGSGSPF